MGSSENRIRRKWQDDSGKKAGNAETAFFRVFEKNFEGTEFQIRAKPNELRNVYVNVPLGKSTLKEIYTPDEPIIQHGLLPDYAIDNIETSKTIYVEVKRQDGWVEGGKRTDGRGNAHERSCKYFTPGLQKILRQHGNLGDNVLPFWTVFQGNITRDPCRVREITCWYDEFTAHYFFWRNSSDQSALLKHFNRHLKHLLL